ncbi:MAG: Crp/Fnr family transcriptional regulator [Pseudomonadota bacterium]|nr:Crp/Fnr family transcriptional regulator [Pseudomonadota bacterium]
MTSISEVLDDGARVGLGMIGRDGMTNSSLLLGCERAPYEAVVEIGGGTSLRLEADQLRAFCAKSAPGNALFLRFVHTLGVQMGTTAASNLRDASAMRLARWLLMCHDRIDGDDLCLHHAHIARLLGVRRATVTDMLHVLEGAGAIKNTRGHIVVRDRAIMKLLAGESYGYAEQQYHILVGPSGDRSPGRSPRPELIAAE